MSTSKILQPTGKWAKSGLAVSDRAHQFFAGPGSSGSPGIEGSRSRWQVMDCRRRIGKLDHRQLADPGIRVGCNLPPHRVIHFFSTFTSDMICITDFLR